MRMLIRPFQRLYRGVRSLPGRVLGTALKQSWADRPLQHAFNLAVGNRPQLIDQYNRVNAWNAQPGASVASSRRKLFGYVDKHSIDPGEAFRIMLSTHPDAEPVTGNIEIYRIGYYGESDRELQWSSGTVTVKSQQVLDSSAAIGLSWNAAVDGVPTGDWRTGFYDIDFVTDDGRRFENVAFVTVTEPTRAGDVLVKLATNTYQAYNQFGGHSLYGSTSMGETCPGQIVSFDRPIWSRGFHTFHRWEYHLAVWLERLAQQHGFKVAYATNFDASGEQDFGENFKLLISSGHDEYWTREEFDNTHRRIFRAGKNTLFLGANTAFWQVRFADLNGADSSDQGGRQMVCWKTMSDPIRHRAGADVRQDVTAMFRDEGRKPETMLMGVAFHGWGNREQPYYVEDTDFRCFADTGYARGELVGDLIGHEWDSRDPEGDGRRLYASGTSSIDPIPAEDLQVLFAGPTQDYCDTTGIAEAVYFTSPAGAKVFSSGTNNWVRGLAMDGRQGEKFSKFNENLILDFLDLPY